jgi:hypothetical protein
MTQDQEMSAEELERIEEERARRLGERPENTEVDNTDRDFDPTKGMFTDSPGYDTAPAPFPAPESQDEPAEDPVGPDDQPSVQPGETA